MIATLRRLSRSAVFLIGLTAFSAAFVVQSGELGSSDTTHRLATTHSFWTSSPPVEASEYPDFGIHGRGGRIYAWYGIGQSLLMLPSDIIGTWVDDWRIFSAYQATDPTVRDIIVSYTTNILVCVLAALACFRLLGLFGFTVNEQVAGTLALIFCTTFLHYTQNMMENNYILLLTLTGLAFQYKWLRTGNTRALVIGAAAVGLNLLTRMTTVFDLLAVALFLLLVLHLEGIHGFEFRRRCLAYLKIALPVYAFFGLLDRLYQFYRFGSFFTNYIQLMGAEQRRLNPAWPASYPFETPFHVGFFGPFLSPAKSIFLFDPLLVLTIIVAAILWKKFRPEIRAYLLAFAVLLVGYICLYARFTDWTGNSAWGDRYVSTSAQILAFISVPLFLRHRADLPSAVRALAATLAGVSALVQAASVAFWCQLEIDQIDPLGHPVFLIGLRFRNIVAFALRKATQWGLMSPDMTDDAWDYVHITTWNFLPFLLKRVGAAPSWVVDLLTAIWFAALAALLGLLFLIFRRARRNELLAPRSFHLRA